MIDDGFCDRTYRRRLRALHLRVNAFRRCFRSVSDKPAKACTSAPAVTFDSRSVKPGRQIASRIMVPTMLITNELALELSRELNIIHNTGGIINKNNHSCSKVIHSLLLIGILACFVTMQGPYRPEVACLNRALAAIASPTAAAVRSFRAK